LVIDAGRKRYFSPDIAMPVGEADVPGICAREIPVLAEPPGAQRLE
jgi:hypothetical protein